MSHVVDPGGRPYDPAELEAKPAVAPESFFAVDLRVGRVTAVEDFPEARKASYKLTVDFGPHVGELRTSAQITDYDVEELRGRTVVGAVNIGTRVIAGFESEFLVLGGLEADGTVRLLTVDDRDGEPLPPGSAVA